MNSEPRTPPSARLGYTPGSGGAPLYVAYHAPSADAAGRAYSVVIAPPLFEERKSAYAALRRLAETLAAAGYGVLRFDYRGSGESGGSSAARRWRDLADDLATAREFAARVSGKSAAILLGLRLGASLALLEAARPNVAGVIALAPVLDGAREVRLWKVRSKIRAELTEAAAGAPLAPLGRGVGGEGRPLDFDGYEVAPAFFDDVAALNLSKDCGALAVPALLIQISRRSEPSPEHAALVQRLGSRASLKTLCLDPFWDKLDDVDTRPMEEAVLAGLEEKQ